MSPTTCKLSCKIYFQYSWQSCFLFKFFTMLLIRAHLKQNTSQIRSKIFEDHIFNDIANAKPYICLHRVSCSSQLILYLQIFVVWSSCILGAHGSHLQNCALYMFLYVLYMRHVSLRPGIINCSTFEIVHNKIKIFHATSVHLFVDVVYLGVYAHLC